MLHIFKLYITLYFFNQIKKKKCYVVEITFFWLLVTTYYLKFVVKILSTQYFSNKNSVHMWNSENNVALIIIIWHIDTLCVLNKCI